MIQNPLQPLIQELSRLPGIGEKSAQRLSFFFLSLPLSEVQKFATTLINTRQKIQFCDICFNIALNQTCHICMDDGRDKDKLCLVAEPKDVFSLEKTQEFKGRYHVLGGLLSPIQGIHPEMLRIKELIYRLKSNPIQELIFAINPTIEGEATILFLKDVLKPYSLTLSKLAYGLPIGSDMDYADQLTLKRALSGRGML